MKTIMRQERGDMAAEWVDDGAKQTEEMGGEALLSGVFFLLRGDNWIPVSGSVIKTQVRRLEDDQILKILLDKLLDRLSSLDTARSIVKDGEIFVPQSETVFKSLLWFGPEMAEEY